MAAPKPRAKWRDLPVIDRVIYATPQTPPSDETREWARTLVATNEAALAALESPPVGSCSLCQTEGYVFHRDRDDDESPMLCTQCYRGVADYRDYPTLCDNDPTHGKAWRNPFTRRNEFFCGACHAKTDEGVVQNRWARATDGTDARVSLPLGVRERALCEAKGVVGVAPCKGQVKPRGSQGVPLCDQHAGKLRR
jgi:hypothetical protein